MGYPLSDIVQRLYDHFIARVGVDAHESTNPIRFMDDLSIADVVRRVLKTPHPTIEEFLLEESCPRK